mmetsp:Transcript_761/g.1353  ORF Transcript_761/g.1353 Transcript_761/m.1353 type:complete len:241 (+) Transcript_761:1915-2637(+)
MCARSPPRQQRGAQRHQAREPAASDERRRAEREAGGLWLSTHHGPRRPLQFPGGHVRVHAPGAGPPVPGGPPHPGGSRQAHLRHGHVERGGGAVHDAWGPQPLPRDFHQTRLREHCGWERPPGGARVADRVRGRQRPHLQAADEEPCEAADCLGCAATPVVRCQLHAAVHPAARSLPRHPEAQVQARSVGDCRGRAADQEDVAQQNGFPHSLSVAVSRFPRRVSARQLRPSRRHALHGLQ